MTTTAEAMLNDIIETLDKLDYIRSSEIPNIDLYMDQVTTFMDSRLRHLVRKPGPDKVMTKTMINNYAKNDLIPAPLKKKYSKEHVLLLLFVYYFKSFLSIGDIQTLLGPITEKYFRSDKELNLEKVYEEVFSLEKAEIEYLKQDLTEKFRTAETVFADAPEEEREFLQKFALICLLSYDVFMKKSIVEGMIDEISAKIPAAEAHKEKKSE